MKNTSTLALLLALVCYVSPCVAELQPFDANLQPGAECEVSADMLPQPCKKASISPNHPPRKTYRVIWVKCSELNHK